jgi:hypothetical protein
MHLPSPNKRVRRTPDGSSLLRKYISPGRTSVINLAFEQQGDIADVDMIRTCG